MPPQVGEVVFRNVDFSVYEYQGEYFRLHNDRLNGYKPYACSFCDAPSGTVHMRYLEGCSAGMLEMKNWLADSGFEELLLSRKRMILHAALIDTQYGGILFSGPSGVGKSTQADLWISHAGAALINGDRPILGKTEAGWIGYGAPYAGSSRCYVNRNVPIKAIVMLQKGPECVLRRMEPKEALRGLYPEVLLNSWNPEYMVRASELIDALIRTVPVYQLICTPDIRAVEILKEELEKGDG